CYTLGYGEPHQTADALLCMGAAFTLAAGVARMTHKRTVGFVGDSTFFHAGMPALLDAIQQQANVVAVVLDNGVTAMTGFQDTPGMPSKHHATAASIEDVARALGAQHVEVVDPYDLAPTIAAFKRAKNAKGPSVIVARHACPVHEARESGRIARPTSYEVDTSKCRQCGRDELGLRCDVPVTQGYERSLGRARSVRTDDTPEPAVAPCAARCPLSLCVQGYAGHIAAGEYREALSHVLTNTVLPESVCRVCDRPCEDACVRKGLDEPVAINGLKRFVVSWAARERPELLRAPIVPTHGGRVAIVGAGPAGLSAALDLRTRGYEVTLHDAADRPGGLLATGVPRYRLPPEALARDVSRVLEAGVNFVGGSALGRDITLDALLAANDAVVLAVGAWKGRRLAIEGETVSGAPARVDALTFLADVARGSAMSAVRRVAVIGGGNAAIDAARSARRLAPDVQVVVACLEWRAEMPALRDEIDEAEREGIVVRSRVEPVRFERGAVMVRALDDDRRETAIEADLVIVAIGQETDLAFLKADAPDLARTPDGMLAVDPETCCTSHPRIFAAGDVVPGPRTVTAAIAWGLRAGWGVDASLRGIDDASERVPPARPEVIAR
ncbi:MAG: FAD-dependent oxidoreductase, partial [Deltaproteobacteria bacterium]